tara:strand:- start:907 stop:1302 length:396 start_codon:yes stop_codon:yes gene_type:complete
MQRLPRDCQLLILHYFIWPDACHYADLLELQVPPIVKKKYFAAPVIHRTIHRMIAFKTILNLFVEKCIEDAGYRSQYLYIHRTEDPHLCFRKIPKWIALNPYKYQVKAYLKKEIENYIHAFVLTMVELQTI